jgi:transposase
MKKEDARYPTREQLHERRKQVARLHVQGIKVMQIVTLTGLSYPTVKCSIKLYERGSWEALRPADRGNIIGQCPEQLKMDFCPWSRRAVMLLIEQQHGITLPVRTVGKDLAHRGGGSRRKSRSRKLTSSTLCSGRCAPQAVHDCQRDQPGKSALEDH